jgi:CBS domain-containing protein
MAIVPSEASIVEASRLMRERGATELLVLGQIDGEPRRLGIVTEHDIVTRVLALGLDPAVVTAGDITDCN